MRLDGCFGCRQEQQAIIWLNWKKGESLSDIGRILRKHPGSIHHLISFYGGIRQRGTNENTNGLLRQYFPRKTDLSGFSQKKLDNIAFELNGRPRKILKFYSPIDKFSSLVASTG